MLFTMSAVDELRPRALQLSKAKRRELLEGVKKKNNISNEA